jgi:hypothetical protein
LVRASKGTIDAIIDPLKPYTLTKIAGLRFLILEDLDTVNRTYDSGSVGVEQWGNLVASANDIIEYNGTTWEVVFDSQNYTGTLPVNITNIYTGVQYKWNGMSWTKSMEGIFPAGNWQIIL